MDFKALMNTSEYDFLRTNERLGDGIMLPGLGGSYAYGTNNEGRDIDFSGAVITPGFKLPAKYVIHAVGPRWFGGEHNEPKLCTVHR